MHTRYLCALLVFGAAAQAATVQFITEPFAGSTALSTPGRQVVGGEDFITFDTTTDQFALGPGVFGFSSLSFVNSVITGVPASGVNVIVLETFDNDNNAGTPFGAGNAANLIADQITSDGPGFFVYFNSGLDLPRLVFSTNLSDNTADLKILARMTNLSAQPGALATFTESNFVAAVPEPSTWALTGAALLGALRLSRQPRSR